MASFIKEVNPRLAKRLLVFNGRLANRGLTSLVKEVTVVVLRLSHRYGYDLPPPPQKKTPKDPKTQKTPKNKQNKKQNKTKNKTKQKSAMKPRTYIMLCIVFSNKRHGLHDSVDCGRCGGCLSHRLLYRIVLFSEEKATEAATREGNA